MHKILSLILESKKRRIELIKNNKDGFISVIRSLPKVRSLREAIEREKKISIIGEIKQASPSAGVLRENFNLQELAHIYEEEKIVAISVLTEEEFFLGKLTYIQEVKSAVSLPVLRKDFLFEDIQIYESRAIGADAVLLIARILDDEKLKRLLDLTRELGMEALVEVRNQKELLRVLKYGPVDMIGINNRNLDTLAVNIKNTETIFHLVPEDTVVVSESGINTLKDMLYLKGLEVDAALIGEAFMKAPDVRTKIRELRVDD